MKPKLVAFISGHRDLTEEEFNIYYKPVIDNAILNKHVFYVCDYYGADFMAQKYLKSLNYPDVIVVHMLESPRNYVGDYTLVGGFSSDEDRDAFCTGITDYDIAWSRKPGSGTERNIKRREEINNRWVLLVL